MSDLGTSQSGQGVVPYSLKRLASGWVDQDMVTIRKMAADGATADDIGAAVGWKAARVVGFIRRNKLVWNRVRGDLGRHVIASAASIGGHAKMGHAKWADEGIRLRQQGMRCEDIAKRFGLRERTVTQYFARHGIKPLAPVKRKQRPSEAGMLALIIELHVEGVLSEGQVQKATGLDRVRIRELAEERRAAA